ncbi:hypothetical protein [Cohnella cholangitidis]|uniref:Uncharacterized protein n=1 Tax=Cohnella cholangitidis TaxID=2598458 RepID=A0A7G5C3Q8_9BACL|nr:hypothetical protein [Cohnella cholangitidis]QMV43842.1 hypothetical protein FPL14_23730 [Cohnella cholangitidis]
MRQSRKEANLEWMMREGFMPERREAMALSSQIREEFGSELGDGSPAGAAHGRRHPPGGRG